MLHHQATATQGGFTYAIAITLTESPKSPTTKPEYPGDDCVVNTVLKVTNSGQYDTGEPNLHLQFAIPGSWIAEQNPRQNVCTTSPTSLPKSCYVLDDDQGYPTGGAVVKYSGGTPGVKLPVGASVTYNTTRSTCL